MQVRGLERLCADQKVALPDDTVSRDAIALAADDTYACVQIFQVRAGHLVGRLGVCGRCPVGHPGGDFAAGCSVGRHYPNRGGGGNSGR
jgi:excinuclease ABC subunit C